MTSHPQPQPDTNPTMEEGYLHGFGPTNLQHLADRTVASQAAFFLPHLRPGMSLLDCGCGPGTITIGLARIMAPGQVVGIDIEPRVVERADALGKEQGLPNLHFRVANVFQLPFADGSFDAAFAHTLLHHLNQPPGALQEMRRVLKPGGVIGIRDSDDGGRIIAPANQGWEDYHDLQERVWQEHYGRDRCFGRRLRSLLRQVGFVGIESSASYECYGTPEATRALAQLRIARLENTPTYVEAVAAGLVDQATLDRMIAELRQWGEDPDAFCADAKCEAVGWKEQ